MLIHFLKKFFLGIITITDKMWVIKVADSTYIIRKTRKSFPQLFVNQQKNVL